MSLMLYDIILYVVSRFPRGVGRTRLMKLLFLIDAMATRKLGYSITGIEWRRWRYGPFSREVLDALDNLVKSEKLVLDAGPEIRYRALCDPPELSENIRVIVDRVVNEYGFLPLRDLLRRVYEEYNIDKIGLGEKIELDWYREVLELANISSEDEDALIELIGRICEEYREALEYLPGDTFALYTIAVMYLSKRNPEKLRGLTSRFLGLLEEAKRVRVDEQPPPELLKRIRLFYHDLLNVAAEAVRG